MSADGVAHNPLDAHGKLTLVDWLAVGLVLLASVVAWAELRSREQIRDAAELQGMATVARRALADSVSRLDELIAANVAYFYGSAYDSEQAFRDFNLELLNKHPAALQVQWLQWVPHDERARFEAAARADGLPEFNIWQPDSTGGIKPAPEASDYLVIRYGLGKLDYRISHGLDVLFSEARRERYRHSIERDKPLVSAVIPLYLEREKTASGGSGFMPGVILSRPVYAIRPFPGATVPGVATVRGFITIILLPDYLFQAALDPLLVPGVSLLVSERSEDGFRHFSTRSLHHGSRTTSDGELFVPQEGDVRHTIDVLGHVWQIAVRAHPGWHTSRSRSQSLQAAGIGLLATTGLFIALLLYRGQRRRHELARQQAQALQAATALQTMLEARVAERTQALEKANERLRQALQTLEATQDELVRNERLASLGELVAGVAHELNTPIGNSLTVASTLVLDVREFAHKVEGGSVRRSLIDHFVTRASKAAELLLRNVGRAAELVANFKGVAVDQSSERRRTFDLACCVRDVVEVLRPRLHCSDLKIDLEIPEGIELDSFPGALGQVLMNLIENAAVHGFDPGAAGLLRITGVAGEGSVRIEVVDNGRGIPVAIQARIFDPFFTTRLGQ